MRRTRMVSGLAGALFTISMLNGKRNFEGRDTQPTLMLSANTRKSG